MSQPMEGYPHHTRHCQEPDSCGKEVETASSCETQETARDCETSQAFETFPSPSEEEGPYTTSIESSLFYAGRSSKIHATTS
jgi:hypothetical protein